MNRKILLAVLLAAFYGFLEAEINYDSKQQVQVDLELIQELSSSQRNTLFNLMIALKRARYDEISPLEEKILQQGGLRVAEATAVINCFPRETENNDFEETEAEACVLREMLPVFMIIAEHYRDLKTRKERSMPSSKK